MRKLALLVLVLVVAGWLAWRLLPAPEFSPVVLDGPVAAPKDAPSSQARSRATDDTTREERRRTGTPESSAPANVRRDLRDDESRGGHTIARHVGRSEAQLRERLARESISAASTYPDLETAERVVGLTLRRHAVRLAQWEAREGPRPNLVLPFAAPNQPALGRVLRRGASVAVDAHAAVVVLRWRPDGSYVLTSYPEERARGRKGR